MEFKGTSDFVVVLVTTTYEPAFTNHTNTQRMERGPCMLLAQLLHSVFFILYCFFLQGHLVSLLKKTKTKTTSTACRSPDHPYRLCSYLVECFGRSSSTLQSEMINVCEASTDLRLKWK